MDTIRFADLPELLAPLDGGTFCGLTTAPDGTHRAVVLLDDRPTEKLNWTRAGAWAESRGGARPTRAVAALLHAPAKSRFEPDWYWTSDGNGDSSAWLCYFDDGLQYDTHESEQGCARAVRLIHVTA